MATPGPFSGISWSTANHITLGVVAAAVVFPALSAIVRLVSSPLALLLLSPVFVLFVIIAFVAANISLGYALDLFNARHNLRVPAARLRSAAKPLAFATPAAWQAVLIRSQWSSTRPLDLPLLPRFPVLSTGLNQLITLIVRDFVLVWYKELSSSPMFPGAVSKTIHSSLENLFSRVDKLDLPALVVKRLLPKITTHIDQFRRSEIAVRGAGLERHLTQSDELDMLLASRYAAQEPLLKLHPAVANLSSMHTRQTEEAHLRAIVDAILPHILPEKEARSRAVHVAVREIVVCAVIYPVMEMLSDPDFWNKIVDQTAGAAIRQQ
jgi:sorting nexin-25